MRSIPFLLLALFIISCGNQAEQQSPENAISEASYDDLVSLFSDWRAFENPPLFNGAPDYRKETFASRRSEFDQLQSQLLSMDTSSWTVPQKVDWKIVWAEMNGYDFNDRVLKPWERDPAFYKVLWTYRSDVPAQEGAADRGA